MPTHGHTEASLPDPWTVDADTYFDARFPPITSPCARLEALRAYWGPRLGADLERVVVAFDALLRARPADAGHTPVVSLGPWSMPKDTFLLPPALDGNLFAGRVEHGRVQDALGVPIWEVLTNALCIGSDAGGNLFFVLLTLDDPTKSDVFLLGREEFGYAEPEHVATSLRAFVHAAAMAESAAATDDATVLPVVTGAQLAVNFENPCFRALGRRAKTSSVPKPVSPYHWFAWRGRWIHYLLKDPVDVPAAATAFAEIMEDPNAPKEEGVLAAGNLADPASPLATMTSAAAYWLLHFWFAGNDDALTAVNRVVATSALPLVRDTAAFVSACRAGAKGTEPFVEARAAFLRLRGN